MNHISKSFAAGNGRSYKSHTWELREGGFRRVALVVGNGIRPVADEPRLVRFLLDRGFKVMSLDVAFPRLGLKALRSAVESFARSAPGGDLPLYLLASSFSAGALLPAAASLPGLAAIALLAPVVDFPPPRLGKSPFFMPSASLAVGAEDLCGESELAKALAEAPYALRFRKGDLRAAAAGLSAALAEGFAVPIAAFSGEEDPFITKEGRGALERSGARLYGYPRVRHDPGRDRYADNFYADLGSFLDEVESSRKKRGG